MDDVEEVPVGQLHGRLFGQVQAPVTATPAPLPNPIAPSIPSSPKASIGKAPPEPEVKTPNAEEVGKQAALAGNVAKQEQKPVETPSALAALGHELVKNWWVAPLAVLGHQIITKGLAESEKPKATSIDSRKIGAGPQINTNTTEPRMVGDLFPADVSTKELGKTPKDMPLVEASAANKAANETANELIAKGQPVKPTTAKPSTPIVPPTSTEGLTKGEQGMKNYLVKSQYGGGTHGEKAYEKTVEILGKRPSYAPGEGGGLSKEETNIIKDWRKENIEGPKVNLTKDMKRVLKGGGGIALLAAIPGFAEAAQQKNYGKMTDIASDFLVLPFAQSREAGMPKAQEESIIAQKFKEAQKLGSPYRAVPPPR